MATRAKPSPLCESALRQMFDHVRQLLAGRLRFLVPHGFSIITVTESSFTVELPTIWQPVRGAIVAIASENASTDNIDELRQLIEMTLTDRDGSRRGELVSWSPQLPSGPRPGNLTWTVTGRVRWL